MNEAPCIVGAAQRRGSAVLGSILRAPEFYLNQNLLKKRRGAVLILNGS